jgi:hypothetical protein
LYRYGDGRSIHRIWHSGLLQITSHGGLDGVYEARATRARRTIVDLNWLTTTRKHE